MKQKPLKLYNIGFSVIYFYLFPPLMLLSIPLNFGYDSFVLCMLLKRNRLEVKPVYKKSILKVFLFGYLGDIAGALLILLSALLTEPFFASGDRQIAEILNHVSINPFYHPVSFLLECLIVAAAGVLIYLLNAKFSFRKTDLDKQTQKRIAKWIAILTAPYLFFVPMFF